MNILTLLTGPRFQLLIKEGEQVDRLIKNSVEALLKQSSPEQENALNLQWYRHSLPNPFSLVIAIILLPPPVAWGWAMIVYYFDFPVPATAILCVSIMPFAGIYAAFIPWGLGRGYVIGLRLIRYFYLFNVLLTLTGFFLTVIKSIEINDWIGQFSFFPLQLLGIYLCRHVMNSNAFYTIVSFFRTTRLLVEAKKARKKTQVLNNRHQIFPPER
ncbi:hypothetical protein [Enterobacter cloacae]|uniref:hypothetical protein n=5 Tax=Enterobacter cloacae TaxID=550 RepID=UPI000BA10D5C|nr:hypothetical protein [Enterobacter cloacae]OZU93350.1 hypothetical protein CIW67_09140 [Enterobacter cloacae]PAN88251.1 hypothetical protein CIW66_06475 [Enterobacter cloacae]PAO01190.1 hypothetical protein CIW63_03465 [Enterobacter cloacae]HAS1024797.1 hypothetical protein [Enterobacter cloacae]HAS1036666.1 hypothetical protein [Enterobacter cloacae]